MARIKLTGSELGKVVNDMLKGYGEEITKAVNEEIPVIAEQTAADINDRAHQENWVANGYDKSWGVEKLEQKRAGVTYAVRSTMPWLPHLLEHGHAKRGGGRTRSFKHIEPAEQKAIQDIEAKITEAINNAGG